MAKQPQSVPRRGSLAGRGVLRAAVAVTTHAGRVRPNNEDSFLLFDLGSRTPLAAEKESRLPFAPPGVLLAVADGMGGHSAGQVASAMCVEKLPQELLRVLPPRIEGEAAITQPLERAIHSTNRLIHQAARENSEYKGMGTTLTAAWLVGARAWVAQVGDSRAYRLRGGVIEQLTRDQTVGNSLSEAERELLHGSALQNLLLQAVGATVELEVEVTSTELAPGDFLLLCSDGLYRVVSAKQLVEILRPPGSLKAKAETLVQRANESGGPDNITAVLCEVIEERGSRARARVS